MKIVVCGFAHETNSFAPGLTEWEAFSETAGRPVAMEGAEAKAMLQGQKVPASGFLAAAAERGWAVTCGLWCSAEPSGYISAAAFAHICDAIVGACERDADAVYLDLHGAAMAEGYDDAEGELLTRIRRAVGDGVPIVGSLDLHANMTATMLEAADALVAFRTHPHVDQIATGRRAAELLARRLERGRKEPLAADRLPYLICASAQPTTREPAGTIYRRLAEIDARYGTISNFCMAFPCSDFEGCGPRAWSYGERAEDALGDLMALIADPAQWRYDSPPMDLAVDRALQRAEVSARPIVIADTQDNPGAGGTGNTTGAIRALLEAGAGARFPASVAVAVMYDPACAKAAAAAGTGSRVTLRLGAAVPVFDGVSDEPLEATFTVRAVSDGKLVFKGPKNNGFVAEHGTTVCLELDGILIVVASARIAAQDREQFRVVGIEPEAMKILVVKSSNHFRADFEPLVEEVGTDVIVAKAKGAFAVDPADLPWQKLPSWIRRRP